MNKLLTKNDVFALLHAAPASAALGAAIESGLIWLLAEKPQNVAEVARSLNIPAKRGHYWLQTLEQLGVLERVPQGYALSALAQEAILNTHSQESWKHLVLDERERSAWIQALAWVGFQLLPREHTLPNQRTLIPTRKLGNDYEYT
jgi:hypothetical protein